MKRMTACVGVLGLILAVSACVPLDAEPAPPSATPDSAMELPALQSPIRDTTPEYPEPPELEPYSTAGLEQRIKSLSKDSEVRQLMAGNSQFEDALPGSESVLVAEVFSGEHYVALPRLDASKRIAITLRCKKNTRFDVMVYEQGSGAQIAGSNSACGPSSGSRIGFGWGEHSAPGYLHVIPEDHQHLELTVISYEPLQTSGS